MNALGWPSVMAILALSLPLGCRQDLPVEYGKSGGQSGNASLNGLGALRRTIESAGWKTQDVRQLSPRLESLDAVVWQQGNVQRISPDVMDWFGEWLRRRPRTLVIVLPDLGSEREYWEAIADSVSPAERLERRRRLADRLATELTDSAFGPREEGLFVDGVWFTARQRLDGTPSWEILSRYGADDTGGPARPSAVIQVDPNHRASRPWLELLEEEWLPEPVDPRRLSLEPLVTNADGVPLAVRLATAEFDQDDDLDDEDDANGGSDLGESSVIVVAGGSLINNFAVARHEGPQGRELVRQLRSELIDVAGKPKGAVGFLLTSDDGLTIRGDREPTATTGMEWLTVWPLSLVTIHLAWIGIVACLILLPIFGRPRRLVEGSQGDFADHVHAVGLLMKRSGGEAVARERISEYFRRVRGETVGPWVLPEPLPPPPPVATQTRVDPPPIPPAVPPSEPPALPGGPTAKTSP